MLEYIFYFIFGFVVFWGFLCLLDGDMDWGIVVVLESDISGLGDDWCVFLWVYGWFFELVVYGGNKFEVFFCFYLDKWNKLV